MIKITASTEELDRLIQFALEGGKLRHEPVTPAEIPLKIDKQYFAIDFVARGRDPSSILMAEEFQSL